MIDEEFEEMRADAHKWMQDTIIKDYEGLTSNQQLNLFRNLYYNDGFSTEKGIVANAINDILPKYCKQQEEIDNLRADLKRVCAERDAHICTSNVMKSEAIKEFANRLKNKIKTECNPYGKPTFDYDTSISIMRYIDNLVKEMEKKYEIS